MCNKMFMCLSEVLEVDETPIAGYPPWLLLESL